MLYELLADAPAGERSLLELRPASGGLADAHARIAARLRVFVLSWDPLGWLGDAFEPRATATGDGDGFELVLYVPLTDLEDDGLLGELCASVVEGALDRENRSLCANDAAVILAEAGRADEARARVDANQRAFPRDVWTHVHAGDAHRALGEADSAEQAFHRAGILAEAQGDAYGATAVAERLADLLAGLQRALPLRQRAQAQAVLRRVEKRVRPVGS